MPSINFNLKKELLKQLVYVVVVRIDKNLGLTGASLIEHYFQTRKRLIPFRDCLLGACMAVRMSVSSGSLEEGVVKKMKRRSSFAPGRRSLVTNGEIIRPNDK